ncbi:MAG: hypothetical protein ACOYOU_00565 [Kiritimatiellia bacterium]
MLQLRDRVEHLLVGLAPAVGFARRQLTRLVPLLGVVLRLLVRAVLVAEKGCQWLWIHAGPVVRKAWQWLRIHAGPFVKKCWQWLVRIFWICMHWWLQTNRTQRLAAAVSADRSFAIFTRTGTSVDTGRWFLRGRVSVGVLGDELLLLAPGRRPFVVRAKRPEVSDSLYNAVTGELVLAPAVGLPQRTVRVSPVDGYAILRWVQDGKTE